MAVEEKKVLDALELKFKGKSISKDFKKAIAKKWAAKIDNDTDIDGYIEDREDVVLEAASEGDRRATEASKKSKAEIVKTVTGEETTTEEEPTTEIGKLMKMVEGLQKTVQTMQQADTSKTLTERFNSDPRLKGIDPKLLKGRVPATEAELEAAITEAAEDLKDFIKTEDQQNGGVKVGFKTDRPGFGGKQENQQQQNAKVPDAVKAFTATVNKSSQVSKT